MKINRRQLQSLIRESIAQGHSLLEAAYSIIYAAGYLNASDADFGETLRKNPQLAQKAASWLPLDEALGNIHSVMSSGISSVKRQNPRLQLPEEVSIFQEAQAAGQADFHESVYKYIETVSILTNVQTPIGMSAADALGVFGIEGGGVLFRDTAIADAAHLISLMSDDSVLSWLDELEAMKPVRRRLRESYSLDQIEQLLDDVKSDYGAITPMTIYKNYRDLLPMHRGEFFERTSALRLTMLPGPIQTNFSGLNTTTGVNKKPAGLWYACGIEWIIFAREEYFAQGFSGRNHLYHLELDYTSFAESDSGGDTSTKVLMLSSPEDVYRIESEYGDPSGLIDWTRFAERFGGIHICPIHLVSSTKWGKWWDVDSGCVWESTAIKSSV